MSLLSPRPKPIDQALIESISSYDKHSSDIKDIQSAHFMVDILPVIQSLYLGQIHELNVVDVGARTAAGTGFLSYLHHPKGNAKIRMSVDALDISDHFKERALQKYPEINDYVVKDIYDRDMPEYDLVVCSHTIEHVPDVEKFITRLTEVARDYVVFACPYNEDLSKRYSSAPGNHINSIDNAFIAKFHPISKTVYDGMCFTGDLTIFVLPGKAQPLRDKLGDFRALEAAGDFTGALTSVKETLHHRTNFPTIWVKYANLLFREKKMSEAINACAEAVKLQPSDPALRFRLAQMLRTNGNEAEALVQAHIAWDMRKVPDFRVFAAEDAIKQKDFQTAKKYLEEALFHKKDHANALKLMTQIEASAKL